jgi:hypothetical protein
MKAGTIFLLAKKYVFNLLPTFVDVGAQAPAEVIVVGLGQQRVGGDQRNGVVQFGRVAVPQLGVKRIDRNSSKSFPQKCSQKLA